MKERDPIREALKEDAAMEREHQAHLQALRERRLKAVKGERRMTKYKILSNTDDGGPRWQVVGEEEAVSAETAIRSYLKSDPVLDETHNGEYVAVPARSWQPVKVAVETALKFS